jgi:hypothetical protein
MSLFTVEQYKNYSWPNGYGSSPLVEETGNWMVYLPHQCDSWDITTEYSGDSHSGAVAALKQFIEDAQKALVHLENKEELNCE